MSAYNVLSNSTSYEVDKAISRLKLITAEKFMQYGYEYEYALNQANVIVDAIKVYKNSVINAMSGESYFPEDSITDVVRKLTRF